MPRDELGQVDGAVAGGWIKPALRDGFGGYVKQQVPQIYEAYARILNPTTDAGGTDVTWEEVTRRLGSTAHREMQWHAIIGSWDSSNFSDSRWAGDNPRTGELREDKLDALCTILAGHTATPDNVYFGMSTIRAGVAEEWPDAPQLEQPAREWVVLSGPLSAIDQIALSSRHGTTIYLYPKGQEPPPDYEPPERFSREVPNLIWPEDHAWFVASEYDLDSTLVGGTRALIDAILAAPELETWEVDGEVSLMSDADKLNPVPEPPPDRRDGRGSEAWIAGNVLATLSGEVTAVVVGDDDAPDIEVTHANGLPWHLLAVRAEVSPAEPVSLLGRQIEAVEIDDPSEALRCRLTDGALFEANPLPTADDDHPAWRVDLPDGMSITRGTEVRIKFPGT